MSELKVNSIKGVGASSSAITVNNTDGTCTVKATNNLSNRRITTNGDMRIAQRGTSSTSSGYATIDRFPVFHANTDEAPTQAQVAVASGTTPYTLGFRKALKITNGNQTSGAGSNDYIWIQNKIEAQDIANSGWNYLSSSSYITLSFWVKSSVAQTFKGYIETIDGTAYQYPFETGSLTADTWTKITKKIPGNSNLTFDDNNEEGFKISIIPMMGTDKTANSVTEDAWSTYSSSARIKDVTTTWYTTNDATFELTGVQLEVSEYASEFEHKSYSDELLRCMRYCQVFGGDVNYSSFGVGVWKTSTSASCVLSLMTQMRAAPTLTVANPTDSFIRSGGTNITTTTVALDISSPKSAMYNANASSGGTNGHGATHLGSANTNTTLTLSSEL